MSEYNKHEWPHYTDKLTLLENIGPKVRVRVRGRGRGQSALAEVWWMSRAAARRPVG